MARPKNRKETDERERKVRRGVILSCTIVGLVGIVICGYGHAAVNSNLYIAGGATIKGVGAKFKSIYMQDLTPQECTEVGDDITTQMIDKRDGKNIGCKSFVTVDAG